MKNSFIPVSCTWLSCALSGSQIILYHPNRHTSCNLHVWCGHHFLWIDNRTITILPHQLTKNGFLSKLCQLTFILHLLVYLFCYHMVSLISLRYYFLIVRFSSGLYRYLDPHLGLIDKVKAYWETVFNPLTPRSNLYFSLLSTIQFL